MQVIPQSSYLCLQITKHTGVLEAAYETIVRLQLEYASIVWYPYTQTYSHKIKWYSEGPFAGPLTTTLHVTASVKGRRTLVGGPWTKEGLMLDFASYMGLLPFNFHYISKPSRMTRHSHPLAFRQIHTSVNFYKNSFLSLAVVQWNRLPVDVVMLPTVSQFNVAVRSPVTLDTIYLLLNLICF